MTRIQKIAQSANFFALKLGLLKADKPLKKTNIKTEKDTSQNTKNIKKN